MYRKNERFFFNLVLPKRRNAECSNFSRIFWYPKVGINFLEIPQTAKFFVKGGEKFCGIQKFFT
jgi:hypothetical protein